MYHVNANEIPMFLTTRTEADSAASYTKKMFTCGETAWSISQSYTLAHDQTTTDELSRVIKCSHWSLTAQSSQWKRERET